MSSNCSPVTPPPAAHHEAAEALCQSRSLHRRARGSPRPPPRPVAPSRCAHPVHRARAHRGSPQGSARARAPPARSVADARSTSLGSSAIVALCTRLGEPLLAVGTPFASVRDGTRPGGHRGVKTPIATRGTRCGAPRRERCRSQTRPRPDGRRPQQSRQPVLGRDLRRRQSRGEAARRTGLHPGPATNSDPAGQTADVRALVARRHDCYAVAPITATNLVPRCAA